MKEQNPTLMETVPAARELRNVPGFDPMKFLRRTVAKTGEAALMLDLPYKRLWFRLARPEGRMLLNPLRITDQMAIFEARLYAGKDDASLLSSFTATQTAKDGPEYIRAAQDEALNEALDNAGFGIQLCDVPQAPESGVTAPEAPQEQPGSEPPVKETAPATPETLKPQKPIEPAKEPETAPPPVQEPAPQPAPKVISMPAREPSPAPTTEQPVAAPVRDLRHCVCQYNLGRKISRCKPTYTGRPSIEGHPNVKRTADFTLMRKIGRPFFALYHLIRCRGPP